MKKTLLTLVTAMGLCSFSSNAAWVKVTSTSELKAGVDYILVGHNVGLVMTTQVGGDDRFRIGAEVTITDNKIESIPANAAILHAGKTSEGYTLYQTNDGMTGFIYPKSDTQRTIALSQTPQSMKISFMTAEEAASKVDDSGQPSIFEEFDAVITAVSQSDKNILGMFKNPVDGIATPTFQFMDQNDEPVALYRNDAQTGTDLIGYNFTPTNGSTVTNVESFTLGFENAKSVVLNSDDFSATLNGNAIPFPSSSWRGNPMTFVYRDPQTTPGTYEFKFGAGLFEITRQDDTKELSPELTLVLRIPGAKQEITFDPENGSSVNSIELFTMNVTGVTRVSISDDATTDDLTVSRNGIKIDNPRFRASGTSVIFNYTDAYTEEGEYTFTLAEGLFNFTLEDGSIQKSPKKVYTLYILKKIEVDSYETSPANEAEIKSFSNYIVTFPGATSYDLTDNAEIKFTMATETGSDDLSSNLVYDQSASTANSFALRFQSFGGVSSLEAGTYTVEISEGAFLLNGTVKSPAIKSTFTINPNLVEGSTLKTYCTGSYPEEYIPMNIELSDFGMNEVSLGLSEEVTINRGCTENIVLKYNGREVASIPATATYEDPAFAEAVNGGAFGSGNACTVTLRFGSEMRNGEGTYTVTVPANFFQKGNELLGQSIFNFCIGLGTFIPANGSTVNLTEPDGNSVNKDGALFQIKLAPYNNIVPNDYFAYLNDTTQEIILEYKGSDAVAVMTNEEGEEVARFPLNSQAVVMQRGNIVLSLRQNGNTPINVNGVYTVFFPQDFFRIQTGDEAATEFISFGEPDEYNGFRYTVTLTGGIDNSAPAQTFIMTPEPGSYNPYPTVTLTYENYENIIVNENTTAGLFFGSSATTPQTTFTVTSDGNKLILTPVDAITTPPASEYTKVQLRIPANCFKLVAAGKEYNNEAVTIEDITIKNNDVPELTPVNLPSETDDPTVLAKVEFTCNYAMNKNSLKKAELRIVNADNTTTKIINYGAMVLSEDKKSMSIEIASMPDLAQGTYQVFCPKSLYNCTINGKRTDSPEQIFYVVYGATGVEVLGAADGTFTVINLSGVVLLQNAGADEFKALEPGFYIVNGKKVIKK